MGEELEVFDGVFDQALDDFFGLRTLDTEHVPFVRDVAPVDIVIALMVIEPVVHRHAEQSRDPELLVFTAHDDHVVDDLCFIVEHDCITVFSGSQSRDVVQKHIVEERFRVRAGDFHDLMSEQVPADRFPDCHVLCPLHIVIFKDVFIHGCILLPGLLELIDLFGDLDTHLSFGRILFPDHPLSIDQRLYGTFPKPEMTIRKGLCADQLEAFAVDNIDDFVLVERFHFVRAEYGLQLQFDQSAKDTAVFSDAVWHTEVVSAGLDRVVLSKHRFSGTFTAQTHDMVGELS